MYGSTCADMQVDVMGVSEQYKACCWCKISISGKEIARRIAVKITPSCCLSEKWRIINLLDDIWMLLTEVESLGSWRGRPQCDNSGRPRGTTPADDRCIVLQARRNRRQTAGEIARHTTQVTGRPISRFTVARRLHGGGLFARRPGTVCTFKACPSENAFSVVPGTPELRDNEWGRVLFTDESRFSLSSYSHRILSGESGEAAIIPRTSLKGTGMRRRYGSAVPFHGRQCTMSSHSSCRIALREQTLSSSYLTTSNDSVASIGAARRMGSNASTTH
ncbi:hypothetical protein TNCV_2789361 [Trichonephila clavipes]|nr:hypothetical protein TNCV_2789361 [Trichonephila clavipes]